MATGIIGLAARSEGIPAVPQALLWLNVAFYAALVAAFVGRLVLHPRAHLQDLRTHGRAMGYFTLPAGTAVLGVQVLDVGGSLGVARILWFVTLALWLVFVYAIPVTLVTRPDKPEPAQGLTGTWLVWIVATQGTSILGTRVAGSFGSARHEIILACTALWLAGGMFYLWVIQLIVRRMFFSPLNPAQLSPTYWIDMGAVAISTLAGASLLNVAGNDPLTIQLRPFIAGLTLLFWSTATWWIPWLVIMGVWRHWVRRHPLWFEVGFWGMVFPLGMYTVATANTGRALQLPILNSMASGFVWVALVVWAAALIDLVITRARQTWPRPSAPTLPGR